MSQNKLSDKKLKAIKWAENTVNIVKTDKRPYVKCRDSRPITDLKNMLETSAELYGDNIAFLQKYNRNEPYTPIKYHQVLSDVNALGTALISRGMKDRRIAVIGENCYQWAISYLASACGTGVIVPLDKELNAEELKNQIIRAEVSCVLFDSKHEDTFRQIKAGDDTPLSLLVSFGSAEEKENVIELSQLIDEGNRLLDSGSREFVDAEIDNEAMGILLFTSGTTGKAKGVMLSHKNIVTELMVAPTIFDLTQEDRYLSILPLHHTYECTCSFLMALYKGSSVAFCEGLKYITKNLQEVKPTMMLGVPALYEKLYSTIWKNIRKQGKEKLLRRMIRINNAAKKVGLDMSKMLFKQILNVFGGRMKTMICGGAAINPEILDGIRDFGINALQGYGLTECAPMGAFNPQDCPDSSSVGVPFPGLQIKMINPNDEGIGEICVKGDHVMLGYYQMPEETAKVLDSDGWFHTGDLGYIDERGYTFLTGRQKNVIITKNGKNVYPEELEYQLSNISFIEESYVFGQDLDSGNDITIVASVIIDKDAAGEILGTGFTDDDLKKLVWKEVDAINADAPFYRKIKKIIIRKSPFIKNTSQKIIRFAPDNKLEI
ncbi:MAG: AMP-binding protein [Bacillota bacterium]|nr:AMP-binding protein [Bacillota bacterium]